MEISEGTLGRMAGFVNGEGTFCLSSNGYARFSVTQNNDIEDLSLFVKVFGGNINGPYGEKYTYTAGKFYTIVEIYETLKPWLSEVKKRDAFNSIERAREIAEERWVSRLPNHGIRARYQRGCRCDRCKEASAAYMRNYNGRRK